MKEIKIKEPIEYINTLKGYIKINDIIAFVVTFVIGLITNFNFMISEGLQPDALSLANWNIASEWEISLGRYGIKYINLLRFGLVNKTIIVLLGLCFLALSVVFIIKTFKINNKILIVLLAGIIGAAPQFAETYFFIYCSDVYCLAFLLATITVYLFNKYTEIKKKSLLLVALILTIIVCSLYQAYLGVLIGMTFILLMKYLIDGVDIKKCLILTIKFLGLILLGVILYYIILKLILLINNIDMAAYKGANSLSLWNIIVSLPKTIYQSYKDCFDFFFSNTIINNGFWRRNKIYAICFGLSYVWIFVTLCKSEYEKKGLRVLYFAVLLLFYPIGISIMNIIAPTTSINLVTGPGIVTVFLLTIVLENSRTNTNINNIVKFIQIILLSIIIWTFILSNTYTAMAREETHRNYYTVANNIYNRITQLDEYTQDKQWMFSYCIEYLPTRIERTNGFVTANYETWNNYNGTLQNISFYKRYLGLDISICDEEKYRSIIEKDEFKNMPVYPNEGCIRIIDDIIVIKVSEKTY